MSALLAFGASVSVRAQSTSSTDEGATNGSTSTSSAEEDETLVEERTDTERDCPETSTGTLAPERLILLGVRCFKAEAYDRAYTYYRRARRETSSPALTAALGRSLHKLGFYQAARRKYEAFLETSETDASSREKIQNRLSELEKDVTDKGVEVHFTSFPPGAQLFVELDNDNWVDLGRTPLTATIAEDTYRIAVEKPRYRRQRRTLTLTSARTGRRDVSFELVSERSSLDTSALTLKRAGWITGLSSLAVLGGGGALVGLAWAKFGEARDYVRVADYVPSTQNRMVEQAHGYQRGAIVLTAIGGTGLIAGITLFTRGVRLETTDASPTDTAADSSSRGEAESSTGASLQPVLNPRYLGIRASW